MDILKEQWGKTQDKDWQRSFPVEETFLDQLHLCPGASKSHGDIGHTISWKPTKFKILWSGPQKGFIRFLPHSVIPGTLFM